MSRRRMLLLAIALALSVALVTDTSGVSSMSAERGLSAAVVDDADAYVGFDARQVETDDTTTALNVTITNRFPPGTVLETVTLTADDRTVTLGPLSAGDSTTVTVPNRTCGEPVTVEAVGPVVDVRYSRAIECTETVSLSVDRSLTGAFAG